MPALTGSLQHLDGERLRIQLRKPTVNQLPARQNLNFDNMLSEWRDHSRSNSRNSGVFSQQLSELHSRPMSCENHILRATLHRNWLDAKTTFLERFFKIGLVPRGPDFDWLYFGQSVWDGDELVSECFGWQLLSDCHLLALTLKVPKLTLNKPCPALLANPTKHPCIGTLPAC